MIVIDVGNTRVKVGYQSHEDAPLEVSYYNHLDSELLSQLIQRYQTSRVIVCSVKHLEFELVSWMKDHNIHVFDEHTRLGFDTLFTRVSNLGVDRLASVAGALSFGYDRPCMVIDAGTCITYEYINDQKQYVGGGISPGLKMRFQAMNRYTDKLPMIDPDRYRIIPEQYGIDTETAMLSGAFNGFIAEINTFVAHFKNKYPHSDIFICGGDANVIQKFSHHEMILEKHLVLLGLLKILKANA